MCVFFIVHILALSLLRHFRSLLLQLLPICDAPLYAHRLVHDGTEWLIKRVDRPRYDDFLHLSEQVKVAQHEVALCTNEYFSIAVFEFFKQFTRSAERCFFGIT